MPDELPETKELDTTYNEIDNLRQKLDDLSNDKRIEKAYYLQTLDLLKKLHFAISTNRFEDLLVSVFIDYFELALKHNKYAFIDKDMEEPEDALDSIRALIEDIQDHKNNRIGDFKDDLTARENAGLDLSENLFAKIGAILYARLAALYSNLEDIKKKIQFNTRLKVNIDLTNNEHLKIKRVEIDTQLEYLNFLKDFLTLEGSVLDNHLKNFHQEESI